jgi:hypothetical protein
LEVESKRMKIRQKVNKISSKKKLDVVVHAYNSSYARGIGRRIAVQTNPR